uniref:Multidrug resistance protein, MATE family n=1 Tax=Candidatus Kentrum sp. TUN TaxID=2126343 RepID=A0A450ZWG4_9GAMM|nr:MAG: multidrug resistance protein, MATE family [Candidatus Kentron sp. TUN]VFK67123.1 MAG: multidrug resistance protein, MATE family [Candidatus Kentron sp. TUN]
MIETIFKLPILSDFRAILNTALPLGISYMGGMLIGVTDGVMLGRLSPDALGAAGLALSICNIMMLLGWGMLFPMVVLVSRRYDKKCSRTRIPFEVIRQSLWVCGILSIPSYAILWNTTHILILSGQDPTLARMVGQYMDYYLWAIFPIFARAAFALALIAMHRTVTIAIITWLEATLNIILDYGLIFGKLGFPAMGMAGAGLASVIVYSVGHTILFFSIFGFRQFFREIRVKNVWKPNWDILGQFTRLGWPKGLEYLIINAIFSIFALLSGWISIQTIAANTIALQIVALVSYTLPWAVADIVTVRVSAAFAGKSHVDMWRALNGGIMVLFVLLLPLMMIFWGLIRLTDEI